MQTVSENKLQEIAVRIREMREIIGFSVAEMAEKTEVSIQEYEAYEAGRCDLPEHQESGFVCTGGRGVEPDPFHRR